MVKSIQGSRHQLPIFHLSPNRTQLVSQLCYPVHVACHIIYLAHWNVRGVVLQEKLSRNARRNQSKPEASPCWPSCCLVCPVSYEGILHRIKNNCLFLGRLLVMSIQQLRIGRCCNLFLDVFLNIGFLCRHLWPKLPRNEIGSSIQLITFSRCNGGHLSSNG
jgi:hypothetical protein